MENCLKRGLVSSRSQNKKGKISLKDNNIKIKILRKQYKERERKLSFAH